MYKEEIKIVKQAILNEIEGYEFYKLASANTEDIGAKEALLTLAEEEKKHAQWLSELFDQIKDGDTDDVTLRELPDPPSPNIFKWENLDRDTVGLAVSAFGIGMHMEEASVKYYEEAAQKTTITAAKALYNVLASWEKTHLEIFSREYNDLQKEWWDIQGYNPF